MTGSETPKYRGIMNAYITLIESPRYNPGDRLPTVREVADQWKISHATATRIMRELCREGYAYVDGNATYVRDRGPAEVTITHFRNGGRGRGASNTWGDQKLWGGPAQKPGWNEITEAGLVVPPDYVADVMEVERGTEVLRREAVHRLQPGGNPDAPLRPFELSVHWHPAEWIVHDPTLLITGLDDATSPLISWGAWVDAQLGRAPVAGLEAQHARMADEREARLLEVPIGAVVLACVETWQDEQGVTEYRESVHPMGVVRMVKYHDPNEDD